MSTNRRVILYIAMSLDGYISKPSDDLSFLSIVEKEGEDYGYGNFMATVDTVILGRKTYDWVMKEVGEFPHADKKAFVITRTAQPKINNTVFYSGDLIELISRLKSENGKNIYCDGGAEIVNELLRHQLMDEMIISVVPILVGEGTQLFKEGIPEQQWQLVSSKSFVTGLVQMHYKKN
jgi:dihydrofolate reductase